MILRPYQEKALRKIKKDYISGKNKQVLVLATGLGKTVIFAHLINDITKHFKKKALILVHREELLNQAKEKLLAVNPKLDIGLEMAEQKADGDHDVIIASVATIGRKGSPRIQKFNPKDFIAIITDECHHSSSVSYRNIYSYFNVLKDEPLLDNNKEILMLGVTATPSRNDNEGIDKIYDHVVYEYGIIKGIENGYLVPIRAYRVDTQTDLTQVHRSIGDFNLGELGDMVNNEERNKLVLKAYLERVPGQQALVFAVDVKHTMALCKLFQQSGIAANYVIGTTLKEDRRRILKDFSSKKIKVLVNCTVFTEGFDEPNIQAILMARPTQSGILFQQMVGRGTRTASGKDYLTIIDFVDNTYRQTLQTSVSLLGIPGKLDFQGKDILSIKDEIDQLIDLAPYIDLDHLDINNLRYQIEEVDLLSGLKIPDELIELTSLDWVRYMEGHYQLSLPEKKMIHVKELVTGGYEIINDIVNEEKGGRSMTQVTTAFSLPEAFQLADYFLAKNYPEYVTLVSTKSPWRKKPVSPPQADFLRKMGVNQVVIDKLNRGTASRLLNKLKSYSKHERRTKFMGQIS